MPATNQISGRKISYRPLEQRNCFQGMWRPSDDMQPKREPMAYQQHVFWLAYIAMNELQTVYFLPLHTAGEVGHGWPVRTREALTFVLLVAPDQSPAADRRKKPGYRMQIATQKQHRTLAFIALVIGPRILRHCMPRPRI